MWNIFEKFTLLSDFPLAHGRRNLGSLTSLGSILDIPISKQRSGWVGLSIVIVTSILNLCELKAKMESTSRNAHVRFIQIYFVRGFYCINPRLGESTSLSHLLTAL